MKAKRDTYQEVTDRIVASLEAGTVPWMKPWRSMGGGLPVNLRAGRPYRGVNVFLLAITAMLNGYSDPRWGTYKAIGEKGGQVRKGEKGTQIVFWKRIEQKIEEKPKTFAVTLVPTHPRMFGSENRRWWKDEWLVVKSPVSA